MKKIGCIVGLFLLLFQSVRGGIVYRMDPSSATLKGSAKAVTMGSYNVLSLGASNGYLDMGSQAGADFAALTNFTISCYYRVDESASLSGNGYFLWSYSTSAACTASSGIYHAYRLNAQRIATSTGGYNNETGYSVGSASAQGRWVHVCYTQSGTTGTLYIDGVKIKTITGMPIPESNFTTKPTCNWIGRAPFTSDNYLANTLVYDYTLQDEALTASEVAALANRLDSLDYAYRYGMPGDFTELEKQVAVADAFVAGIVPGTYPQAAIDDYVDVVEYARSLVQQGTVSQTYIDDALDKLATALTALKLTEGFTFDLSSMDSPYDRDRGFVHPGGLHTQEDFDRIKKLLAEGNDTITTAYGLLCSAAYAQSDAATYPVETIVRGGGVGENYINAARGAAIAYQNALRWRIGGTEVHARHAVDVLMKWCRTTKYISGDSNWALAAGLYGYEFAQAAELLHGYEGWSDDDFEEFRQWILQLWYPACMKFLRARNGTWENADKWWQAPGHYWSNWGLCNALAVISIGVLCDDVFIYNQGMSYIKYDQVGTFKEVRTDDPIRNDGLTEFWGNLVVTTTESDLETGAYGMLGQMNESGRDTGHAAMALGLAVDVAHQGWNQGDDLFSYMNHRIAAGIEYVAAQTQSVAGLPWTNYIYGTNGLYYTDSRCWTMTEPALGAQIRPYWGTVIGHYEGVKGVSMPFSKNSYNTMGIDEGGQGSTSGGYDHLGYSVLMNYRTHRATAMEIPTELSPAITYNGTTVQHNELGGLTNTFMVNNHTGVTLGTVLTLSPQLPDGASDTGKWEWNTGDTSREITLAANQSTIYRVTYTNENGVKSQLCFPIAVDADCKPSTVTPYVVVDGVQTYTSEVSVPFGTSITLGMIGNSDWGTYEWENGTTGSVITLNNVTHSRTIHGAYVNEGGMRTVIAFKLTINALSPVVTVNGVVTSNTTQALADEGACVELTADVAESLKGGSFLWDDGNNTNSIVLENVSQSSTHTVSYVAPEGTEYTLTFYVYVNPSSPRLLELDNYTIQLRSDGSYLTNQGVDSTPSFQSQDLASPETQQWYLYRTSTKNPYYELRSLVDSSSLNVSGVMVKRLYSRPYRIVFASGTNYATIYTNSTTVNPYLTVESDGTIQFAGSESLYGYPFLVLPVETVDGIKEPRTDQKSDTLYDLSGRRLQRAPSSGIYICNGKKVLR